MAALSPPTDKRFAILSRRADGSYDKVFVAPFSWAQTDVEQLASSITAQGGGIATVFQALTSYTWSSTAPTAPTKSTHAS